MNNKMPKVSVIVPLFNSKKYIKNLLKSLVKQTFQDIEIICVDDGSTDNSAEIIKNFIKRDDRISYYHQKNAGGGAARNFGISKALGEYLICLDSDDLYEKTLVEDLYTKAKKTDADIVICKYKVENRTTGKTSGNKGLNLKLLPKQEVFSSADTDDIMDITNFGPCNKLYRREFIQKNKLRYSETKIIDDIKFSMLALILAERITTVNKELSTYRYQIEGSGSKNREKKLTTSLCVYMEIYVEFCARGLWDKYKNIYFKHVAESLKYELSFPVSDEALSMIEGFLFSEIPFSTLEHQEIQRLFDTDKIKKNYIKYFLQSVLFLGLSKSANKKFKQYENRILELEKLGIINRRSFQKG